MSTRAVIRTAIKETVYGLAHASGLDAIGRRHRGEGCCILTYHSFGPAAEHPYLHRLPVSRLAQQLDHLKASYDVVGIEEAEARLQAATSSTIRRPMAAITVDDGYADNFEILFPMLQERRLPATIFLATDYLDTGRLPWPTRLQHSLDYATADRLIEPMSLPLATPADRIAAGRHLRQHLSRLDSAPREQALERITSSLKPTPHPPLRPLTWDEVRTMQRAGVRIGSHTHHHGWLDRLGEAEVVRELEVSRQRIEAETGVPCRTLAYPNGSWNEAVATAAARAGYTLGLTQDSGVNRGATLQPLAMKRIEVPYDERIGTFACRVAGIAL